MGFARGKRVGTGISSREKGREWGFQLEKGLGEGSAHRKRVRRGVSVWDKGRDRDLHPG